MATTSISLGTTKKRVNSTSQSFVGTASTYDCIIKEPCSVNNPVFTLKASLDKYNYASWNGKYYWVDDTISFPNGIIEVHAHLDPLATYKSEIKATPAFVKYASGAQNAVIDDLRMQPEKQFDTSGITIPSANLFSQTLEPEEGSVVFRVCEAGGSHAGISTYVCTASEFKNILTNLQNYLNTLVPGTAALDVPNALIDVCQFLCEMWGSLAGTGSWSDNLISAVWVPIKYSDIAASGSSVTYILFGSIQCPCSATRIDPIIVKTHDGTLSLTWSAAQGNMPFLKNPRFASFQICAPGAYAEINTSSIKDQASLHFYSALNLCTGQWSAIVTEGLSYSQRLASFGGCLGVDIRSFYGQSVPIEMQGPKVGFNLVASAMSFGATGGSSAINGIQGAFNPSGVNSGCNSGSSTGDFTTMYLGGATEYGKISIIPIHYQMNLMGSTDYSKYCAEYGYPVNQYYETLPDGFVCCVGASVKECAGANDKDMEYINTCLNTGIYIE